MQFICEVCKAKFDRSPSLRRGKHITCSYKCSGIIRGRLAKGIRPKHCPAGWNKGISQINSLGSKHHHWKGGRYQMASGYYCIHVNNHPYSFMQNLNGGGYILEHRKVMEDHLGRFLDPSERIHHIDGDKTNNRIENLQLFSSSSDHTKLHDMVRKRDALNRFV